MTEKTKKTYVAPTSVPKGLVAESVFCNRSTGEKFAPFADEYDKGDGWV